MSTAAMPLAQAMLQQELSVLGRLSTASNVTLVARLGPETAGAAEPPVEVVYKPTAGTRPLWDFDADVLARHEVAAYEVAAGAARALTAAAAAGDQASVALLEDDPTASTPLVPLTVLRTDGPFGEGSVQLWVDEPADAAPVIDVVTPDERATGWLTVFEAMDDLGRDVLVVHADDRRLRRMALLDDVLNNADRKGQHVLTGPDGALYGVDHGLCFHDEPKLRTVLWGWAGVAFDDADLAWLASLERAVHDLSAASIAQLLPAVEVAALHERLVTAARRRSFRQPPRRRHAIPWPPL